ncbi:MAG: WD40 repeat domain-containing protein, partial [Tepidisphaerales bacterium]
ARQWDMAKSIAALRVDDVSNAQASECLIGFDASGKPTEVGGNSVAFDADGGRLLLGGVSVGADTEPKQEPTREYGVLTGTFRKMTVTSRGPVGFRGATPVQLTVSPGPDKRLLLMDLERGIPITTMPVPGRLPESNAVILAMSADTSIVAAVVNIRESAVAVVVWDARSGLIQQQFAVTATPTAIAISPDGTLAACSDDDGDVTVWPVGAGGPVAKLHNIEPTRALSLAFGHNSLRHYKEGAASAVDGWLLAAGYGGGGITIFDAGRQAIKSRCVGSLYDVYALAFSPNGMTLASCGRGNAKLWDIASGRHLLDLGCGGSAEGLAFSPDGNKLAVAAYALFDKASFSVWNLEESRGMRALRGLSGQVEKVHFSPDGTLVAGLSQTWQVGVWETASGHQRFVLNVPPGNYADNASFAFSADNRQLAFSSGQNVGIWDMETGKRVKKWPLPPGLCDMIGFHPSGKFILLRKETQDETVGPFSAYPPTKYPRVIRIRELVGPEPLKPIMEIDELDHNVYTDICTSDASCFLVDGDSLKAGSVRRVMAIDPIARRKLWEVRSETARGDPGWMMFDPTGTTACICVREKRIEWRHVPTGKILRTMAEGPDYLCISPHGKDVVLRASIESMPGTDALRFADATTRQPWMTIASPSPIASGLDSNFDTSGRYLAWGTKDGLVVLCDVPELQRRMSTLGTTSLVGKP